jgi:hypothetical protein
MTRLFAAAAISIGFAFFILPSAVAQSDRDSAPDNQCFPWQELRDGHCVSKPSQAPPPPIAPVPEPVASDPCTKETRNLLTQCACPENTHRDAASGACLADIQPAPKVDDKAVVCDGGTITGGACGCPTGFHLMAAGGSRTGGTCVRAENCLGGELTATGTCLCNGQVVMSGETYLLEYVGGKCVPKRCPIQTLLKDGKCVAMSAASPSPEPEERASRPHRRKRPKKASIAIIADTAWSALIPGACRRGGDFPSSTATASAGIIACTNFRALQARHRTDRGLMVRDARRRAPHHEGQTSCDL